MEIQRKWLPYLNSEVEVEVLDSCPWCHSKSITLLANRGDGLPVMRCQVCHLGFLGVVPTDLSVFYDDEYYKRSACVGEQPAFAGYEDYSRSYSASSFRWLAMLIRSMVGSDAKTIFDLGAATGTFLQAARSEGFEPFGSELNPDAAREATRRGAHVVGGPFDPGQWAGQEFDVVTALEVLEHVRDLRTTMLGLAELVAPGGLLVFLVPNVDDYLIERYGDSALDFQKSYDHTLFLNPAFLSRMAEELFGADSLTLFVHEAEEWDQTVSAALGVIRFDSDDRTGHDLVGILTSEDPNRLIDELTGYEALALALTAAKFSEHDLADMAVDRAVAAGVEGAELETARAQIHRHRGELIRALGALETAMLDPGFDGDSMVPAILVDCVGDLLGLMGAEDPGLAKGFEQALGRFHELDRTGDIVRRMLDELEKDREERRSREGYLLGQLDDRSRRIGELDRELVLVNRQFDQLTASAAESSRLRSELNAIYGSRAWRIVSALRRLKSLPVALFPTRQTPSHSGQKAESSPVINPVVEHFPYLVSVIMPVYNKGQTLRDTVASVRAQTLTSVEIVVWDDGSTDDATLAALDEVARLDHVEVVHSSNQGVIGARNSAISYARGEYICCLDPDDLIDPTYLEKAVTVLKSGAGYSIVYPYVHSFGDVDEYWETQDLDPALILEANHVPICAVFERAVFRETGGFSAEMADGYEDWEFWAHAAELGFRGKVLPEHLFHYRFSQDSGASRDASARQRADDLKRRIASLHPRLARTGSAQERTIEPRNLRPRVAIGRRRFPRGKGGAVVITLPWFTVGGADSVVEMAVRRWTEAGRTVVVLTTNELGEGMTDRTLELRRLTPFVYQLPQLLPRELWHDAVVGIVESLESPVIWNVGSAWLYDEISSLKFRIPDLRVIDQQFNEIGHIDGNRRASSEIDVTVAAYSALADSLRGDGRSSGVKAIYVGIDEQARPEPSDLAEFRKDLDLSEEERTILYLGRLSQEKRPQWMIDLAGELRSEEVRVVVVGSGPLRKVVAEASSRLPNLTWIEEIDSVGLAIAAADVVALPSKTEGIPLVAMEALELGTPVVATRVGGLPDLEDVEGVTLSDPDDFGQFVGAIKRALSSSPTNVELPTRFRADVMMDQLDELMFNGRQSRNSAVNPSTRGQG